MKVIIRVCVLDYWVWSLGFGNCELGIGDWGLVPIPNPQSPIPNPQSPIFDLKK